MEKPPNQLRSLIAGGLLPVLAYTLIEETAGLWWGLVAGMSFAVVEIGWEWRSRRRVDPITWGGAAFILVLGTISLATQEGLWFKLQPAILSGVLALVCWVSVLLDRALLVALAVKQGALARVAPPLQEFVRRAFKGLTLRVGLFFAIHGGLGVWAALSWSTRNWALLKGLGLTIGFGVYLVIETLILRWRIRRHIP